MLEEEKVLNGTQEEVVDLEEAEEFEETEEVDTDLSDGEADEELDEEPYEEPDEEPDEETEEVETKEEEPPKPKQTPEENAKFARLRREKEAKAREAADKLEAVLKPFNVKSLAELMSLEDVELTEEEENRAQRKALENGENEEIYIELEKTKKTRMLYLAQMKAQKLQEEISRATKERADSDIAAFKAKYPDIDPQSLVKNEKFMKVAKRRLGDDPLIEIYEDYLYVSGERETQAKKIQESKAARSTAASATGKLTQLTAEQKKAFDEWNKRNPHNQFKSVKEFLKYN